MCTCWSICFPGPGLDEAARGAVHAAGDAARELLHGVRQLHHLASARITTLLPLMAGRAVLLGEADGDPFSGLTITG